VIYAIDMDGVVADFVSAAARAHGVMISEWPAGEYDICKVFRIPSNRFWGALDSEAFWSGIPLTSFADELMYLLNGKEKFFLTSPTMSPQSLAGKCRWIQAMYPKMGRKFLIGPQKHYCARPGTCLVDDSDANVNEFRKAGGQAVLVPQPWNSAHDHVEDRLEYLKKRLA